MCLFTPQLSLVLISATHGGMARLSCPGWLIIYGDGLPAHKGLSMLVQAGPGVKQLR